MVFNATFKNISALSWLYVFLVEETRVPVEIHRPAASHWQTLSVDIFFYIEQVPQFFFFAVFGAAGVSGGGANAIELLLNELVVIMIVPDEGYSRNASCALNSISTFYYYDCVDTSTGELLIPRGYHQTSAHGLDLLNIYYWNLQPENLWWICFIHILSLISLNHLEANVYELLLLWTSTIMFVLSQQWQMTISTVFAYHKISRSKNRLVGSK